MSNRDWWGLGQSEVHCHYSAPANWGQKEIEAQSCQLQTFMWITKFFLGVGNNSISFMQPQTLPTMPSLGPTLAGGLPGYNLKFKMKPTFLSLLEFDANQEKRQCRRVLWDTRKHCDTRAFCGLTQGYMSWILVCNDPQSRNCHWTYPRSTTQYPPEPLWFVLAGILGKGEGLVQLTWYLNPCILREKPKDRH